MAEFESWALLEGVVLAASTRRSRPGFEASLQCTQENSSGIVSFASTKDFSGSHDGIRRIVFSGSERIIDEFAMRLNACEEPLHRTRTWAAPSVKRNGQSSQEFCPEPFLRVHFESSRICLILLDDHNCQKREETSRDRAACRTPTLGSRYTDPLASQPVCLLRITGVY